MLNKELKYKDIGNRIKEARELAGLSQKQLAEKIGYGTSTAISYLEAGDRKVSVVDLDEIAKVLNRDIRYFLGKDLSETSSLSNDSKGLNVRVALRSEGLAEEDQDAISHIIEMAKRRHGKQ